MLQKNIKILLIILDDFYKYSLICEENHLIWENYENEIWENLLVCNGLDKEIISLQEIKSISKRLKKHRDKNLKIPKPIPNIEQEITKLFRATSWARYEKLQQLTEILKRLKKKEVYRFYPRSGKRYKNIKKRRLLK